MAQAVPSSLVERSHMLHLMTPRIGEVLIISAMVVTVVFLQGCGGATDKHGCILDAGCEWCPSKNKCLQPWIECCADDPIKKCSNTTKSMDCTFKTTTTTPRISAALANNSRGMRAAGEKNVDAGMDVADVTALNV